MILYSAIASIHFFFHAEDGIRDYKVTGVQTCALPILEVDDFPAGGVRDVLPPPTGTHVHLLHLGGVGAESPRSEERRVGKECRSRSAPADKKKNEKG